MYVQWIMNAYGVKTCHKNDVRLSYDESRLATIFFRDGAWRYQLEGVEGFTGEYRTEHLAMAGVEDRVGGKRVGS